MTVSLAGIIQRQIKVDFIGPEPPQEILTAVRVMALVRQSILHGVRSGCTVRDDRSGLKFRWRFAT